MSKIKGGVAIAGFVSPMDSTDVYPTHVDTLGKGGFVCLNTVSERDNYPESKREVGMMVYVKELNHNYILQPNGSWDLHELLQEDPYRLGAPGEAVDIPNYCRFKQNEDLMGTWWFGTNGDDVNYTARYRYEPVVYNHWNNWWQNGWGYYQDSTFTVDGTLPIGMIVKSSSETQPILDSAEFSTLKGIETQWNSITHNIRENTIPKLWRVPDGIYTDLVVWEERTGDGYMYEIKGAEYHKVDQSNDPDEKYNNMRFQTNHISGDLSPRHMPKSGMDIGMIHLYDGERLELSEFTSSFNNKVTIGDRGFTNCLLTLRTGIRGVAGTTDGYDFPTTDEWFEDPIGDHGFFDDWKFDRVKYSNETFFTWKDFRYGNKQAQFNKLRWKYDGKYKIADRYCPRFLVLRSSTNAKKGDWYITGLSYIRSDERLKNNVVTIDDTLEKIDKYNGYTFNWIDRKERGKDYGIIAQEIADLYPSMCFIETDEKLIADENHASDEFYSVNYEGFHSILIAGVKELHTRLKKNQERIELRDTQIAKLKELINEQD